MEHQEEKLLELDTKVEKSEWKKGFETVTFEEFRFEWGTVIKYCITVKAGKQG